MKCLPVIATFTCLVGGLQAATPAKKTYDYQADVLPILKVRCIECHGPKKQEGKIRLDTLATDFIQNRAAAETWHDASNMLKRGEMPPEDAKELTNDQRRTLIRWIDTNLQSAVEAGADYSGQVVLRRLNRLEYQHTMADLLGLEMKFAEDLPADALSTDGFKNNGASLGMSALQIENYFQAARRAMDAVLIAGEQPKRTVTKLELPKNVDRFIQIRNKKKLIGERSGRMGRVNYWHAEIMAM